MDILEQMISEYAWLKLHIDNRDIRVSKRARNPDQVYMSGQKTFNLVWLGWEQAGTDLYQI